MEKHLQLKQTLILIVMLVLAPALKVEAQKVAFSETLTNGVTATPQCAIWNNFRASLLPRKYYKLKFYGTFNPGKECNDTTIIRQLATGLRTLSSALSLVDGANTWQLGTDISGRFGVNMSSLSSCDNPGFVVKPCITNANWGGVGTATCGGPTQVISVEFYYNYGDNNASLSSFVGPAQVCNSSEDIKVKLFNTGVNIINSVNIEWTVDGLPQTPFVWSGPLDTLGGFGFCDTTVTIGSVNFTPGVSRTIRMWTSMPNGVADTLNYNDTIEVVLKQALSGNYTIGGTSPDYTTVSAAVNDLNIYGHCGPVTFNVAAGTTYTENPISLTRSGSLTSPIVFQKSGVGPNPVIYGKNGTGTADAIIGMGGVSYVTFDGIDVTDSITNTAANPRMEYGYAVVNSTATRGSQYVTIKNCKITLNRANTATIGLRQSAFVAPTSLAGANHNNRYENIKVENSYNGILLLGTAAYPDSNCVITSTGGDTTIIGADLPNDIGNGTALVYGIQVSNTRGAEISNCIIRNLTLTGTTTIHGIYLNTTATTASYGNTIIRNNRIYNITRTSTSATGTAHGIRVDISPNGTATVTNNVIYGMSTGALATASANFVMRGITHCLAGNGNAAYYNNSVYITQGANVMGSSAAFLKAGTGTATILKNNILINNTGAQTGAAKHYAIAISAGDITSDYNMLWSVNTNGAIGLSGSDRVTLNDWRTATSEDSASLSYLPNLSAANGLMPLATDTSSWTLNGRGVQIAGNNTDINGNTRSETNITGAPDLGAYEITPTSLPPMAIAVPPAPAAGTTQAFILGADTVATIEWAASSAVPAEITARFYSGEYAPNTNTLQQRMNCYWEFAENGPGTYSYRVNLHYNDAMSGNISNESDLRLAKQHLSNPWVAYTGGLSDVDVAKNVLGASGLTDFSSFTGTDNNNPLPVKLNKFNALNAGHDAIVTWSTASETNASHFILESSADGRMFNVVTRVDAKGNSQVTSSYSFIHENARLSANASGVIYYRLISVDQDGSKQVSPIISVRFNKTGMMNDVVLNPNPFTSDFTIQITAGTATGAKVLITDLSGKVISVSNEELNAGMNRIKPVKVKDLESGIYIVIITTNDESRAFKVVKE